MNLAAVLESKRTTQYLRLAMMHFYVNTDASDPPRGSANIPIIAIEVSN